MNSALMLSALFCIYATVSSYAADCAGGMSMLIFSCSRYGKARHCLC